MRMGIVRIVTYEKKNGACTIVLGDGNFNAAKLE